MRELSLNVLDIAMNSVEADATEIKIEINENGEELILKITDNGKGMTKAFQKTVTDPFTTSRTTRNVGMGIPLLKLAAEMTGGKIEIMSHTKDESPDGTHGTVLTALFDKRSIDCTPLGDIVSTVTALIGSHPDIDFAFCHTVDEKTIMIDTKELLIPLENDRRLLANAEVLKWIGDHLEEQYQSIGYNKY